MSRALGTQGQGALDIGDKAIVNCLTEGGKVMVNVFD